MKQPSRSPVLYLRAYYFHHVLAPCQPPAPVRHYFAFSCLGGFIFRWPGGAVEVPAAVSMLHKIYRSLLKCLPSPSGKGVERRRSSYPQRTDRTEFPPSQFRGSTVSLALKGTNQIYLFLIGRMRIPDESDGTVWPPACHFTVYIRCDQTTTMATAVTRCESHHTTDRYFAAFNGSRKHVE
jgi:hypothetical protein